MTHLKFKTVEDWCAAVESLQNVAFLPAKLAAEALDTTPSAISKQLSAGKIPSISIGDRQYVAASFVSHEARVNRDMVDAAYANLEAVAERGEKTFYGVEMEKLGLTHRNPAHRRKIAHLLARVSRMSYERDGILLSSIVHYSGPEPTSPGDGYFNLIDAMREEFEDDLVFFGTDSDRDLLLKLHMESVWATYAPKAKAS